MKQSEKTDENNLYLSILKYKHIFNKNAHTQIYLRWHVFVTTFLKLMNYFLVKI